LPRSSVAVDRYPLLGQAGNSPTQSLRKNMHSLGIHANKTTREKEPKCSAYTKEVRHI
jgi:hypothetical protein